METRRFARLFTLKQLRNFIGNSAVTRRFAERYDLVYFGTVNSDDESRLVKGITVSNSHRDSHYLVGTALGRDLIFLQRSDMLHSANHKKKELYNWNILAIDLAPNAELPHVYVEGRSRHGEGFYETLAMKRREFSELPYGFLSNYDPLFAKRYTIRLAASTSGELPSLLSPENAAIIAHHFSAFDYEWHDDMLYVYFLSQNPSLSQLELMLKAGVWLAGELDKPKEAIPEEDEEDELE